MGRRRAALLGVAALGAAAGGSLLAGGVAGATPLPALAPAPALGPVSGMWGAAPTPTVPADSGTCEPVDLPVALVPGPLVPGPLAPGPPVPGPLVSAGPSGMLSGTLCTPVRWAAGPHTVDVLVHGAMYARQYWDWPVQPETYSYVRRTVAAGRAAFFYDQLGAGVSTHPTRGEGTFEADVHALHQVIQWARARYPGVDVIGHSLGSVVVIEEAGEYNDADRVVLTGLTHGHGIGFLTLPTAIYPATLDPLFADLIPLRDGGYETTLPGRRAGLFYSSSADPAVIAYDEAHKDTMTLAQAAGAIVSLSVPAPLNISNRITAPVLLVDGQEDAAFCNVDVGCRTDAQLRAAEAPYFTAAAGFTAITVPDTGHDLPLHPSAGISFADIDTWLTGGRLGG